MTPRNRIVIEAGTKKVFASALDWPGWSRSAKTEQDALGVLAEYAGRYGKVADLAGVDGVEDAAREFVIVERLEGNATTDFGAPGLFADAEFEQMSDDECERQIDLLQAGWTYFDEVASRVSEELRKGPRGGGRNRSKIIQHVCDSERGYVRNLGIKVPEGALDTPDGLQAHRDAVCEAIRDHHARGESARKWPLRYFIRRATWHVLDHAWEMEDKDLSAGDD